MKRLSLLGMLLVLLVVLVAGCGLNGRADTPQQAYGKANFIIGEDRLLASNWIQEANGVIARHMDNNVVVDGDAAEVRNVIVKGEILEARLGESKAPDGLSDEQQMAFAKMEGHSRLLVSDVLDMCRLMAKYKAGAIPVQELNDVRDSMDRSLGSSRDITEEYVASFRGQVPDYSKVDKKRWQEMEASKVVQLSVD